MFIYTGNLLIVPIAVSNCFIVYSLIAFAFLVLVRVFYNTTIEKYISTGIVVVIHGVFATNIAFTCFVSLNSGGDLFSRLLFVLCGVIVYVTVASSNISAQYTLEQSILLHSFIIIIFYMLTTTSCMVMFICYELCLIPSVLLISSTGYSTSLEPSKFSYVIWTSIGSLFMLIAVVYVHVTCGVGVGSAVFPLEQTDSVTLMLINACLFLGVAMKVPVFPFYKWLVQIHVDTPNNFSMFLSGFLVKLPIYIYYNISLVMPITLHFTECIVLLSIVFVSYSFWFQIDLKSTVAYSTIQEMNVVVFLFQSSDTNIINLAVLFIISHGFLAALMFYILELIDSRYTAKDITSVRYVWGSAPKLGKVILCVILLFTGFPFTINFSLEVFLYAYLASLDFFLFFIIFYSINVITMVGYLSLWLPVLFAPINSVDIDNQIMDLSTQELAICLLLIGCIFFISFSVLLS